MRVAVIGRTEILWTVAEKLASEGHELTCVVTAREAPEYAKTAADFERLAHDRSVPYLCTPRITEAAEMLASSRSDVALSVNYVGIVPTEVIALFPLGVLNAHGGDLPRYRGNACQAWAILNGEERIGLCIHRMVGGELDSGDIIARDYLPISRGTKVTEAWSWMNSRVPDLFMDALSRLAEDPAYVLAVQSGDFRDALRCYPRTPEDGRISWGEPALAVLRLINASNRPYAGAFCTFEGERLIVWDAELVEGGENFCAVPGQVTRVGDGFVEVACGDGKLRLREVEYEGTTDTPDAWIRSIRKRLR